MRRIFMGILAKLAPDEIFTLYVDSDARRIGNDYMSGKHEFQMNLLCSRVQIDLEQFKRLVANLPTLSTVAMEVYAGPCVSTGRFQQISMEKI